MSVANRARLLVKITWLIMSYAHTTERYKALYRYRCCRQENLFSTECSCRTSETCDIITLDVVHILLAVEQLLLPKAMRRLLSAVSQQQDRYLIDTGVRVTHM